MSITISNCDEICHSPTNSSKSKMLYSFPKQGRFLKRRIIMCDKFYDANMNAVSTTRTTAFGYGQKYDFTKDVPKSPPPNTYNIRSQFEDGTPSSPSSNKGFGFGCGRNEMEITGPFLHTIRNKNPGPGTYQLKSTVVEDIITYSLGTKNYQVDHQKLKVPGPGSYPISFPINEKGLYFLSKYKNSCIRSFKGCIQRGKNPVNKIPGPGAYPTDKTDFSPDGKYFLSKIPSSAVRSFGTSCRGNLSKKSNTPGPGNYKLPSQFGHYLSKIALRKPKTQQIGRKSQIEIKKPQITQKSLQKQNIKP